MSGDLGMYGDFGVSALDHDVDLELRSLVSQFVARGVDAARVRGAVRRALKKKTTPESTVDELLAELDLLALADAVGVLRVPRPPRTEVREVAP